MSSFFGVLASFCTILQCTHFLQNVEFFCKHRKKITGMVLEPILQNQTACNKPDLRESRNQGDQISLWKIAQNVTQRFFVKIKASQPWKKVVNNMDNSFSLKKLPKVNNYLTSEKSPNLVTLGRNQFSWARSKLQKKKWIGTVVNDKNVHHKRFLQG
jgi:hypothetical protein